MKIYHEEIQKDFDRDIYWIMIRFTKDNGNITTIVIAGAANEYLEDLYNNKLIEKKHLEDWIYTVIKKWKALGDALYNQKIHYDVYADRNKSEANIIDFLLEQIRVRNK